MKTRRLWIWTIAVALMAVTASIVALTVIRFNDDLTSSLCRNSISRELSSPDGAKVLVVFDRDCGATTGFNTQVSLMPQGAKFSSDTYPSFFGVNGQQKLAIYWTGNRILEIALPLGEIAFRHESPVNGVTIKYSVRPTRTECIAGFDIDWSGVKGDRNEVQNSLSDRPTGNHRIKPLTCGAVDQDGSHMYLQFSSDCGKKQDMATALIAYLQSRGTELPKFTPIKDPIIPSTKTIDCNGPHWSDPAQ